jgi:hypothetical protein
VGEAEKTCKNFIGRQGLARIECNTKRFLETDESDQYILVHHEFAGLAGLEVNQGEDSDYQISNQIAAFLEDQVTKKLVIKPGEGSDPKRDCGLEGSVEKRARNCALVPGSTKKTSAGVIFKLVSRKKDPFYKTTFEVWKDTKTGLIWSDRLQDGFNLFQAIEWDEKSCVVGNPNMARNCLVKEELACEDKLAQLATNWITDRKFAMPTAGEYIQAEANGFREVLTNMHLPDSDRDTHYWTASLWAEGPGTYALEFKANSGKVEIGWRSDWCQVRCVSR